MYFLTCHPLCRHALRLTACFAAPISYLALLTYLLISSPPFVLSWFYYHPLSMCISWGPSTSFLMRPSLLCMLIRALLCLVHRGSPLMEWVHYITVLCKIEDHISFSYVCFPQLLSPLPVIVLWGWLLFISHFLALLPYILVSSAPFLSSCVCRHPFPLCTKWCPAT